MKHELTNDKAVFQAWKGARISYSRQVIADEPFFFATELLFENGIVVQEPVFLTWNGSKHERKRR